MIVKGFLFENSENFYKSIHLDYYDKTNIQITGDCLLNSKKCLNTNFTNPATTIKTSLPIQ